MEQIEQPLHRWAARTVAAQVQARHLSALEVARSTCQRVARLEPQLNAFAHFDAEGRPRRRLGVSALGAPGDLAFVPVPGGVALRGLLP